MEQAGVRDRSCGRFNPILRASGADQVKRENAVGQRSHPVIAAVRAGRNGSRDGLAAAAAHSLQRAIKRVEVLIQLADQNPGFHVVDVEALWHGTQECLLYGLDWLPQS